MVGERWVIHIEIRVNQKFKDLIPPLTADERKQLEENILKDGIRDPLYEEIVWKIAEAELCTGRREENE